MNKFEKTLKILLIEKARRILLGRGYKILLMNYECALGKLDFVCKKKGELVFVVVDRFINESDWKTTKYYVNRYAPALSEWHMLSLETKNG